ncbi:MAG: site-2 protease family protein [Candidatus Marinimicrobia bacterium]|nr:site-2 protease family protein [Candidatus Neomarinimicrobiota bacterium]
MTEFDIRQILLNIKDLFLPRRIGSTDEFWMVVGSLRNGAVINDIRRELQSLPYNFEINEMDGDIHIRVAEEKTINLRIPKIPRINLILFLLTGFTTLLAGTLMEGGNPVERLSDLWLGFPFSFTLLLILGFHETGHYYFARKHKVDATLPYFIPAPTLIGTFGAFIKIKSPIYHRDALLQIGAAGPIAGFLIAIPALVIGLIKSEVIEMSGEFTGFTLGDSLLMKFIVALTHPGLTENQDILLHPIAFAGWIGLLVTMLNLLPIGQLDGGHIAYAMLGEKHNKYAWFVFLALIPLSFFSLNWLVWAVLILVLMRTAKHPPIMDIQTPLKHNDKLIGIACLVIFILCFIPTPFKG